MSKTIIDLSMCFVPEAPLSACANSARLRVVQDVCRSLGKRAILTQRYIMYDAVENVLSDDVNHVLFCTPPKAGSSSFKNLWLNYTRDVYGGLEVHNETFLRIHNLRYLKTYTRSEIRMRLKTYFKFMITRHPLLRVLSAFRQKFEEPNWYYHPRHGRHIEIKYGLIPADESKGDNVTFEQFVRYLDDTNPIIYDPHWRPTSLMCHPCQISYDYIVKLETSYQDYPHIFARLKKVTDSKRRALEEMAKYKAVTDFDLVNGYYNKVPAKYMDIFKTKYHLDAHLFGYTWNSTSMSQGCRVKTEGKDCC